MRISDWSSDVCSSDLGHQCSKIWCTLRTRRAAGGQLGSAFNWRLPTSSALAGKRRPACLSPAGTWLWDRSEEHTSELQSLMRISYAVFCLKKKINTQTRKYNIISPTYTKQSMTSTKHKTPNHRV